MKPRKPINKVSKKRRERSGVPGKLGRVRLYGFELVKLRMDCLVRDRYHCVRCGKSVDWNTFEMAHIKSRGAGGSDILENVQTMCGGPNGCHALSHNCGVHPLPRKDGSNV